MWDYSRGGFDGLGDYISNINWSESLGDFTDIEFASTRWSRIILDAAKRFIPNRHVVIRSQDKPWYNCQLRKTKRRVSRCHKNANNLSTDEYWANFRHIRN